MARWTLGFLFGVLGITRCTTLPPVLIGYALFSFSVIALMLLCYYSIKIGTFSTLLLAISLGASWALCVAQNQLAHRLPEALENQTLHVRGQIITLPDSQNHKTHFDFRVDQVEKFPSLKLPIRVRLSWSSFSFSKVPLKTLKKGDHCQFTVRLKSGRGFWTLGSFDREADLFQKKIDRKSVV